MTVSADETHPLLRSQSNGSTGGSAPIAGHQYTEVNTACIDDGSTASDAFLVDFDPQGDVDNPLEWPTPFKWGIVLLLALTAFTVCVSNFFPCLLPSGSPHPYLYFGCHILVFPPFPFRHLPTEESTSAHPALVPAPDPTAPRVLASLSTPNRRIHPPPTPSQNFPHHPMTPISTLPPTPI